MSAELSSSVIVWARLMVKVHSRAYGVAGILDVVYEIFGEYHEMLRIKLIF